MKLLFEKTKKHLEDQNETYFEHMWAAWEIAHVLNALKLKCLVHSIFPFLYTEAVSGKIECLQKMTKRTKK